MTALSLLFRDPSIGSDEVDSIDDAYAREERRRTAAALDAMDAWRRAGPPGTRCVHISGAADGRAVAIAYALGSHGTPRGVEQRGYGRNEVEALGALAVSGAKGGAW